MPNRLLFCALVLSIVPVVAACSSASTDASSGGASAATDAGAPEDSGSANTNDAGASASDAGKADGGGTKPGAAIYVSPSGSDANAGTQSAPKKTIGAGISASKAGGTVNVCNGTYGDQITLDAALSLLGGFDCSTWTRAADYGAPAFSATTIVKSAVPLAVKAGANGATIDGFSFQQTSATPSDNLDTVACVYIDGATVKLSNNQAIGFAADSLMSTFAKSQTVALIGGNSEIASNRIVAADSKTNAAALSIQSGDPNVHDNVLLGGAALPNGTSPQNNIALDISVDTDLTHPFVNNRISGSSAGMSDALTMGVRFSGTAATFTGNTIDGGDGVFSATAFDAENATALRILGNRISTGPSSNPTKDFDKRAVFVESYVKGAEIANNFILGVRSTSANPSHALCAVVEIDGAGVTLLDNTIHTGICQTVNAVTIEFGATGARIENNLFLGADQASGAAGPPVGVSFDRCLTATTAVATFENNAFVNFATPGTVMTKSGVNCNIATPADVSALETAFTGAGTTASKNVMVRKTCGAADAARCVANAACTDSGSCIRTVLGAFTDATVGETELTGGGFTLKVGAPCVITKGALDLGASTPAVPADFFGTTRTPPASIGAHQQSGTCT